MSYTAIHECWEQLRSHHASGLGSTIGHQFRTQASKAFGDVAVPANRLMGRQDIGQLLGTYVLPLRSLGIWPEQSRGVIHMAERLDRLVAENTILAFVPFRDDIPDQALLRIDFNLLETVLTTALALGPTRAFD